MKRRFYGWLDDYFMVILPYDGKGESLHFRVRVQQWNPLFWVWALRGVKVRVHRWKPPCDYTLIPFNSQDQESVPLSQD